MSHARRTPCRITEKERVRHEEKEGELTRGFWGWSRVVWVCGGWKALPGNHPRLCVMAATHVTHILPLLLFSNQRSLFFFQPRCSFLFLPSRLLLGQDTVFPRIIHIPRGQLVGCRVRGGKFWNFARIENFHILYSWCETGCLLPATSSRSRLRRLVVVFGTSRATAAIESKNFPKLPSVLSTDSPIVGTLVIGGEVSRQFSGLPGNAAAAPLNARSFEKMCSSMVVTLERCWVEILL